MANNKVKSVQGNGTYKDMFIFEITFENGDIGNLYRKTEDAKVEVGQEIEYDLKPSGTIKIITDYNREEFLKKNNTMTKQDWEEKDNKKSDTISRQVALKCAVEFGTNSKLENTLKYAEIFYNWILDKEDNQESKTERDDIPF